MKRIGKYIASVLLVSLLTIGLAACGKAENNSQSGENSDDTIISGKVDVKYTSRDLAGTWREENATKVKLFWRFPIPSKKLAFMFFRNSERWPDYRRGWRHG